jgi:16S rRNA A1518/A1519 N6-dimethyltransferase RsmA/KsgA/DIM1 with predicted DNA glycosylase/AP lyase activity
MQRHFALQMFADPRAGSANSTALRHVANRVEIGPGANALLTQMVLRSSPGTNITALEINKSSAEGAIQTLKKAGAALHGRLVLLAHHSICTQVHCM